MEITSALYTVLYYYRLFQWSYFASFSLVPLYKFKIITKSQPIYWSVSEISTANRRPCVNVHDCKWVKFGSPRIYVILQYLGPDLPLHVVVNQQTSHYHAGKKCSTRAKGNLFIRTAGESSEQTVGMLFYCDICITHGFFIGPICVLTNR